MTSGPLVEKGSASPCFWLALVLASLALAGCRSPQAPAFGDSAELNAETPALTTVIVTEPGPIAPPEPLAPIPPVQPSPPAWVSSPDEDGWLPVDGWGRSYGLAGPVLVASNSPVTFALRGSGTTLALTVGTRLARLNGLACWLGFAPRLLNNQLQVHSLDARKNLLPLLTLPYGTRPSPGTIVIDPGHGGRDPGTQSSHAGLPEKHYALDWARRLQPLLQARGWNVILTRTDDTELSLGDRVAIAERVQADLFISLHFNSAGAKRDLAGIETYCQTPSGMPSNLLRFDEDDSTQVWPNNGYDAENVRLAWRVHQRLIEWTDAVDRGVRRARFMGVLREQKRPAILIEGGYLSNPAEAKKIGSASYRQRLAEAVARGL